MAYFSNVAGVDILLGVIGLLYLIYYYATSTFGYWKKRGIPFAKPLPFFGNFKDNIFGNLSIIELQNNIYNQFKDERFIGYFIMRRPVLLIKDPELIERILTKDFSCFCNRGIVSDPEFDPLSMNLFNTTGQLWKQLRYKLTPTFSSAKLKEMFSQLSKCGEDFTHGLQKYAQSNEIVETNTLFSDFTISVIASCAFGIQLKGNSPEGNTLKKMILKLFAPSKVQTLRFAFRQTYPRLTKLLGIRAFPNEANEYFINFTKSTIHMREKENVIRNDFLQMLMNLKKQEQINDKPSNASFEMSEDDSQINQMDSSSIDVQKLNNTKLFTDNCIAAQTFGFLTAGIESTSSTLSFVLYLLAKHQDIQLRVQDEIDQVLASHGGWSFQAIKNMSYLDQVLQEGMRMFPIATFLSRDSVAPYHLPGTNIVLEKDQRVIIPVPSIHMDPNNYPNPEVFDPDRFKDNNHRPSSIYLPFGDGPRVCFALRFAVLEMKVCLAHVLAQYTATLNEKTKEPLRFKSGSLTVQTDGGIWVQFQKRPSKM